MHPTVTSQDMVEGRDYRCGKTHIRAGILSEIDDAEPVIYWRQPNMHQQTTPPQVRPIPISLQSYVK